MNAVKMIQKENQLELPLFFLDEEPKTAEVIPFEPKPEWTDDEVRQLRDGLLWHSLRVLADGRAGSEIKQETMAWVMSDEVHPFSFVVCCDEAGYDPSGVREGVKSILNRLARVKARFCSLSRVNSEVAGLPKQTAFYITLGGSLPLGLVVP
ncbi:topoisomerase II [Klebsiella pneumoniae]